MFLDRPASAARPDCLRRERALLIVDLGDECADAPAQHPSSVKPSGRDDQGDRERDRESEMALLLSRLPNQQRLHERTLQGRLPFCGQRVGALRPFACASAEVIVSTGIRRGVRASTTSSTFSPPSRWISTRSVCGSYAVCAPLPEPAVARTCAMTLLILLARWAYR